MFDGENVKKLLVVAFRFAPSSSSGTFRSLGFVRHLVEKGWKLEVLSIHERYITDQDNNLLNKVPAGVRIVRAAVLDPFNLWKKIRRQPATENPKQVKSAVTTDSSNPEPVLNATLKEKITHFLKTPDNQIGWFFPAILKFFKLSKPSLVYSSAPPFTGHLIAVVLKKIWRVPLVCDFRDPWLENPFRRPRPGWVEHWEKRLENWVYKNATIIIANTEPMAEAFKQSHPEVASRIYVITNGYDPGDFSAIGCLRDVPSDQCLFIHPGSLYGQRDPRPFLKAVKCAVFDHHCCQLKVQLIGPSEDFGGKTLAAYINDMGLQDHVDMVETIPHQQILERMKGVNFLLLFSQGTNMQVPAKLYEYMGLQKSIFSITEPDSATAQIMNSLGNQHFSTVNDVNQITEMLVNAYNYWSDHQTADVRDAAGDNTHAYLRLELTNRLEELLLSAIDGGK